MRRTSIVILVVAALAGCGDIIGLDGYTDGDGSVLLDATTDAQGDVIGSDATPKDGGKDVSPEAASCNTQTSVCVPDVPTGWAFAVYDPDARGACATGYGAPQDVEEGIDAGAASCNCGCSVTNPDCHSGTLAIQAGSNNTCNNINTQTDVADGGCNTLTQFTTSNNNVAVMPPTPVGGSCTPSASQTIPAVGYAHQGRTCAFEAGAPSGGCQSGEVCLPNPAPFNACIEQAGTQTCPSGYPTQHVIGSKIADTRGCTACGCTFDAGSCGGTLTLWSDIGCANNATGIPATSTCTKANGNHTWKGYSYVPQPTSQCSGTAVSPDGGVAFSDLTTVCCK